MIIRVNKMLTSVAFVATALTVLPAAAQQQADPTIQTLEKNPVDQTIKSIRFTPEADIKAAQVTEIFAKYLGLEGEENLMVPKQNTTNKTGIITQRFTQFYKGIKVQYGGATLAVKNDKVSFITSNYFTFGNKPASTPVLTEREAFTKAKNFVGADLYKWEIPEEEAFIKKMYHNEDTSFMPKGTLVWIEDMLAETENREMHLAYCYNIYAEKPLSRQEVFVDATNGKILFSNALIKHTAASGASRYSGTVPFNTAKPGSTYLLFDSTRGDGVYTLNLNYGTSYGAALNFSSTTNTWPTATSHNVALDAHWGSAMVYDYWLAEHGRRSWDDMDGVLQSYVHYSTNYNNAFWNGAYMTYGDGSGSASGFDPLTSLDVTAHEIGHGVCEATSGLVYTKESGAMNEGFSDCWGATIEHYADPKETDAVSKKNWYLGEEIDAGSPLRRLDFPKLKNDPDTYTGTYWTSVVGCTPSGANDYCGVHSNSGVLNKFYYLLVEGGTGTNDKGNAYAVTGLGWSISPQILYQTELVLTSTATYADCRTASINVAATLYGPCSPEVKSVTDAWYAVGVGTAYAPCAFIGFDVASMDVSERSSATSCPASTVYKIGVKPTSTAFTGGNPQVNLKIAGGTAVSGKDYTLSTTAMIFPVGSTATQYTDLTIFDNGAVKDSKTLILDFALNPMGSNVYSNPALDTMSLNIQNNDSIPALLTPIDTVALSTRTWDIRTAQEVYFYDPLDSNLIAGLKNPSLDLGCVKASISKSGIGFRPALFSPAKRSLKEVTLSPVIDGSATAYQATVYFTNSELAGAVPATLKLLKTEELSDTTITIVNSVTAIPTLIVGTGYTGFSATFTGLKAATRFMLIDGSLSPNSTRVDILDNMKPVLSPNPNDGNFTINGRLNNLFNGQASIVVTNMLGQRVHTSETTVTNGFISAPVSLTQTFAKGVYFVSVNAGDERAIFRLVLDK